MLVTPDLRERPYTVSAAPKEMLSVRTEGDQTIVKINSSSLAIMQECPRKAYYVLNQGLRKKVQSSATTFGSAIHKALEVFYSGELYERVLPANFERIMPDLEHMDGPKDSLIYRAARAFVHAAEPLRNLESSDKRSIASGLWTLTHYFKTYIDDPFVVYSDESGPFVERRYVFTLWESPTLKIECFGQIDLILKNARTGMILVADHKTSSIVGNDFFNRLKPNHQYTGYLMAAKRAYKIQTDSFLVNCIQVKAKPLTARGTPPNFPRQVTRRDEADYAEYQTTVRYFVQQYLNWRADNEWSLGHTNACASYGGCQFLEVCGAPQVIRQNIIDAQFDREVRTWNA